MKWRLPLIGLLSFFFLLGSPDGLQAQWKRPRSSRGLESSQLTGGRVLAFVKAPGKRNIYAIGSPMKVKLIDGRKVEGRLFAIYDTAFVLGTQKITYDSLEAYYVPMRVCLITGSALCIAGGGYLVLDAFNGLTNQKKPFFHVEALVTGIPLLAAGAAILPFKEVKRKVKVWRPLPMDLW